MQILKFFLLKCKHNYR